MSIGHLLGQLLHLIFVIAQSGRLFLAPFSELLVLDDEVSLGGLFVSEISTGINFGGVLLT